jgi:hypothetical protein
MERNNNREKEDIRVEHPKLTWVKHLPKLIEFENWIYKKFMELNKNELSMPSIYLAEVADKELYLEPAPHIFCLYDFVDEFLEEGGIEVFYNSNVIQFKEIDTKLKELNLNEVKLPSNLGKEKSDFVKQTIGLLVIGWGTAIIGIAHGNEIEELSKFRASQLGRYDWTRFSSKEELDWWIQQEKKEAFRNICKIASSEFQSRIKELDHIIIGLKKLISKDNIDLNWFGISIQDKIINLVEFNEESEPNLQKLLDKYFQM